MRSRCFRGTRTTTPTCRGWHTASPVTAVTGSTSVSRSCQATSIRFWHWTKCSRSYARFCSTKDRRCSTSPLICGWPRIRRSRIPGEPAAGDRRTISAAGSFGVVVGPGGPVKTCCVHGGLRPAVESELTQQSRHVVLHRLLAQEHPRGDLLVRQPLGQQSQQLALLVGQVRQRVGWGRRRGSPELGHQRGRRAAVKQRPAGAK